jgi:hypothetical protein
MSVTPSRPYLSKDRCPVDPASILLLLLGLLLDHILHHLNPIYLPAPLFPYMTLCLWSVPLQHTLLGSRLYPATRQTYFFRPVVTSGQLFTFVLSLYSPHSQSLAPRNSFNIRNNTQTVSYIFDPTLACLHTQSILIQFTASHGFVREYM